MQKLYYDKTYLTTWESDIEEILERDGKYAIVLSQTAFYPEGGGQPADKGTINGISVEDVIEEGETVYHILSSKPQNTRVKCELDFERRFDHMQQHTGQHLVSSVFYSLYCGATNSFHLGEEYVSIDISLPEMSPYMVKKVEDAANEYIYKNLKVKNYLIEPEEVERLPLRKLPKVTEAIRIIEIDGIDYSPCCGTHVKTLGEIGMIKIIKTEKYKGVTRVYIKAGKRALLDFQGKQEVVTTLMRQFSASEEELPARSEAVAGEAKELSRQVKELKEKLLNYEAEEILKNSDSKIIAKTFEDKTFEELQILSRLIIEKGEYLLVLGSAIDKKLMLAHGGGLNVKCGQVFKEHVKDFNGRGGGGDKMAQAVFETALDMEKFKDYLKEAIGV
jgi:alanyl-tRNA synthetase